MDSLPRKVVGMPSVEYFAQNDFDSRSFFVAVMKFGGAAQQWLDLGHKLWDGNSATRLGTKFDHLITHIAAGFEIDKILLVPPADVLTSNGQRRGKAYEDWKAKLYTYEIDCTEDEEFLLRTMAEHTLANPAARALIEATVETQLSVFFEIDGHRAKVRPDGVCEDLWWDLKSTSATFDNLYRSVFEYGYAEQEWLYVQAAMALGMDHFRMPFVFTQTVAPYACHVFYLPTDIVEEAGRRMLRVMEEVRLRRSTGVYLPADHGEITELPIPQWARKKEEVEA
jgi:PDDEXK-like domain of unknown function (DUF3799)